MFKVYIGELEVDQSICHRRNTHNHSREHIQNIIRQWEKTPASYTRVDLTPFIQDAAIEEVSDIFLVPLSFIRKNDR